MLLVSVLVFLVSEVAPGDVVRHMLGQFATPEQEESLREQLGLNRPVWVRYLTWLIGSDTFWAEPRLMMPLRQVESQETGAIEWWAEEDGTLIRWRLEGDDLIAIRRLPNGSVEESMDNGRWNIDFEEEIARLGNVRDELLGDSLLHLEDREMLLARVEGLLGILHSSNDLSHENLVHGIQQYEEDLNRLVDPQAVSQLEALESAARTVRQDPLIETLEIAQRLSEDLESYDENTLHTLPHVLGQAVFVVEDGRPELAEALRGASRQILARNLEAARLALQRVVDPMSDLVQPMVEVANSLETGEYDVTATQIEALPRQEDILDRGAVVVLAHQLDGMAEAVESSMPELSQEWDAAAENLREGDQEGAATALDNAAAYFRRQGPILARAEIVQRLHVARYFWGVDQQNNTVLWETSFDDTFWFRSISSGHWIQQTSRPSEYIPLQRGLLRGDPGRSMRTRQPVGEELVRRLRNSAILASIAFVVVVPLSVSLGLVAGLNEGKPIDRMLSVFGLITTASPNFATGIFLIVIFSVWLKWLPGATVLESSTSVFTNPEMLVLPVVTLTLIELGYVLRMTRASMVDVMRKPYMRTAFLKGLPYRRIVLRHGLRNALMAPITVIMLHVNWLVGGIVVVESLFGYPGLGTFLLISALYKDVFAIEAGAMVMVTLAVATQLIADIAYTFLNPRIRYG